MAKFRVSYLGVKNPGLVRQITAQDFSKASFEHPTATWDESNSWRVVMDLDEDTEAFMREQKDFRVTAVSDDAKTNVKADAVENSADTAFEASPESGTGFGGGEGGSTVAVGGSSTSTNPRP